MTSLPIVYIVIGSTRASRLSPTIANWIFELSKKHTTGVDFRLLELSDFKLDLHSQEPHIPMTGLYTQPETIRWSNTVKAASGFIFITPTYNGSYPGILKLYIDYLKKEWMGKYAGIVCHSHRGGDRAVVQFINVLQGSLRMNMVEPHVCLKIADVDWSQNTLDYGVETEAEAIKLLENMQAAVNSSS
ncbi:flavoprotein-like protein [Lipomyces oligophaga]|uniref:flavoprotein-like protein n=1 Tax=Lipomyces oligophaga TaxID=45792 RepID=UPI0034CE9090